MRYNVMYSVNHSKNGETFWRCEWIGSFLSSKNLLLPAILLFFLTVSFAISRVVALYHVPAKGLSAHFALGDFHNVIYFPSLAFSNGENPYSSKYAAAYPVNRELPPYLPSVLLLGLPFALLPLEVANVAWFSLNLVVTTVLTWAALQYARLPTRCASVLFCTSIVLLSRAGHNNLISGQMASIMALATFGALCFAGTRPRVAIISIAIACVKPTFGLPLVILLFLAGYWRIVFAGVSFAMLLSGIAMMWMALHDPVSLLSSFADSHHAHIQDQWFDARLAWMRIDTLSLLARFLNAQTNGFVELLMMLAHVVPLGLWIGYHRRQRKNGWDDDWMVLLGLAVIPIAIYHMVYDSLLIVPLWLTLAAASRTICLRMPLWPIQAILFLLAIPLMNYLTIWPVLTIFEIGPGPFRDFLSSINACCLLAAFGMLLFVYGLASRSEIRNTTITPIQHGH